MSQCCGLSDRPGLYCSPEKDCCWCWLTFRQPERKPSSDGYKPGRSLKPQHLRPKRNACPKSSYIEITMIQCFSSKIYSPSSRQFFAFPQPRYVLILSFWHFSASCFYKKLLIKKSVYYISLKRKSGWLEKIDGVIQSFTTCYWRKISVS